jgi:hypothetical protein
MFDKFVTTPTERGAILLLVGTIHIRAFISRQMNCNATPKLQFLCTTANFTVTVLHS